MSVLDAFCVCKWGLEVWIGVECSCPPVRNDILTMHHLLFLSLFLVYISLYYLLPFIPKSSSYSLLLSLTNIPLFTPPLLCLSLSHILPIPLLYFSFTQTLFFLSPKTLPHPLSYLSLTQALTISFSSFILHFSPTFSFT